ncbi:MAG: hypothetical protein KAS32_23250 [Candidatus Peribacteraceae bacterium]|nr:hypothetical protein [Candidatus Peribacteraceae bacterium]
MISKEEYDLAITQKEESQNVINQFNKEKQEAFNKRMEENPIFTDDELFYSATSLCPCGHGLAYPKECGGGHYWDCSAILKGIADKSVEHTAQLPFSMYTFAGESERIGTTRGVYRPKLNDPPEGRK